MLKLMKFWSKLYSDQRKNLLRAITDDLGFPEAGRWKFMYHGDDRYEDLAGVEEDGVALEEEAAAKKIGRTSKPW